MLSKKISPTAGIYIHIPFCKQACHYCNFHFSTQLKRQSILVKSICQELLLRKNYLNNIPITTIYFGGGTPSLLTLFEIESILNQISKYFLLDPEVEITLEANPDDLTLEKLHGLHSIGIKRLSIGIQSFNDRILRYLNRIHTGKRAKKSVEWAYTAGFDNLSIDLIYAIPHTTLSDWYSDLTEALALSPPHLSTYCLTIEPKTVFGHWQQNGKLIETCQEIAAQQFELTIEQCNNHGYLHYEISNFCKTNRFSKHNINYWKLGPYLGIGPGAHAYNGLNRHANISNNTLYIQSIQNNTIPCTEEILTIEDRINEYIMTSLRTCWGCDLAWIYEKYTVNLLLMQKDYINQIIKYNLAFLSNQKLYLTTKGKLLASKITSDLFISGQIMKEKKP